MRKILENVFYVVFKRPASEWDGDTQISKRIPSMFSTPSKDMDVCRSIIIRYLGFAWG